MNILAIESSTSIGGVVLYNDTSGILAERVSQEQKSHSDKLNIFIDEILAETGIDFRKIDAYAVGQGPGSFTGIRVGANIGKSFAYAFKKPLIAIDSLHNLAYQVGKNSLPILSIINAHKNMVYLATYRWSDQGLVNTIAPSAYFVRELAQVITEPHTVIGDGWETYSPYFSESLMTLLHREKNPNDQPKASALAELALQKLKVNETIDWNLFSPLYIRASEAEESKKGIKIQPLK